MKRLTIGILAHVDAGKTTLSEALLYSSGRIRKLGRVDKGDSFLDNFIMERERGITIFSKQANVDLGNDTEIILLDTPGHVDFSGETERVLSVLDYAILVVSGTDGVEAHTRTLWSMLARYRIPVFIFVNKTDMPTFSRETVLSDIKSKLSGSAVDFETDHTTLCEELAMCDEDLLEIFMSRDITESELSSKAAQLTAKRKLFPCFFGSALRLDGIDRLTTALKDLTLCHYGTESENSSFGARVFKITRDEDGSRLTHVKITSGTLKTKDVISSAGTTDSEKVDAIRIYQGAKYRSTDKVVSGEVCALLGLNNTYSGEGLGIEFEAESSMVEPVLRYRMKAPEGCVMTTLFANVKKLEEEDPTLKAEYDERHGEIYVSIMGEVSLEVLRRIIHDRFGTDVDFDAGNIVYKETIAAPVVGSGHFEPLRHYAEVHLLLEPLPVGSGLVFDTVCSDSMLDGRFQRQILSALGSKKHVGVLTGSPLTDVRVTLIAGREHKKHTVGGDFRQAACRALRQGLMKAENVLLEPYYHFTLDVPKENVGRAMTDISGMGGSFDAPELSGDSMTIVGYAPVAAMRGYMQTVSSYTKGQGRLSIDFGGYRKCVNETPIIESYGYDPESDVYNTPDSVFCSGGSGTIVKWNEASEHMHLRDMIKENGEVITASEAEEKVFHESLVHSELSFEENRAMDDELTRIFESTYGKISPRKLPLEKVKRTYVSDSTKNKKAKNAVLLPEFLLVDGYNIIFAWDELKKVAEDNLGLARKLLINLLANYQGFVGHGVILVFDAYKVAGGKGSVEKDGELYIVYTKEAETADAYIERVTFEMGKKYRVRVATSDNLEQMIVLGHGAARISARIFHDEVASALRELDEEIKKYS